MGRVLCSNPSPALSLLFDHDKPLLPARFPVWVMEEVEGSSLHWHYSCAVKLPVPDPSASGKKERPVLTSSATEHLKNSCKTLVLEFWGRLAAGTANRRRWCASCFSERHVTSRAVGCLTLPDRGNWTGFRNHWEGGIWGGGPGAWECAAPGVGRLWDNGTSQVCWEAGGQRLSAGSSQEGSYLLITACAGMFYSI